MVLFPDWRTMDLERLTSDAELLAAAGIYTLRALCAHDAHQLRAKLELANLHLAQEVPLPSLEELRSWIEEGRARLFRSGGL